MKRWMAGLTPQAYPEGGATGSGAGDDGKAAADAAAAAAATAAAAAADAAKTPEAIAAEQKVKDDAAAAAAAAGTKTPEQLAAEQKEKDDAAAAAAAAKSKVPEKYDFKVADEAKAVVDPADLAYLEQVARASGWSNADAQAALDEHVQTVAAQSARFLTDAKADKDYGGDKFDETTKLAKQAIDRIRPKDHPRREAFDRFLNRGGAGNHIEALSFLADLGRLMGEDGAVRGAGGGGPAKKSTADVLFGETAAKT